MNVLFAALAVGAIVFSEQEIPGLRLSRANPLTGATGGNYRQTDMDSDGAADLVLSDYVALQRNGAFPQEAWVPLPDTEGIPQCDVRDGRLYLLLRSGVAVLRRENGRWQTVHSQDMRWPDGMFADGGVLSEEARGNRVRFARFLHDVDADGEAEIVLSGPAGVHVFRRDGRFYKEHACLSILPALRGSCSSQALWPHVARRFHVVPREMSCRISVVDSSFVVITRTEAGAAQAWFDVASYASRAPLAADDPPNPVNMRVGPMPGFMEPCRLNTDSTLDFAGGSLSIAAEGTIPMPIYTVCVSTDGGQSIQTFQTRSFRTGCLFTDFDGDGALDLILERTGLFDGGLRETFSRAITRSAVNHEIAIHPQDGHGQFSKTPRFTVRIPLEIGSITDPENPMVRKYRSGDLIDFSGDFNGDGLKDLAVQTGRETLSVYLAEAGGIAPKPHATLRIRDDWRFVVADIDGDSRSDIVVRWVDIDSAPVSEHSRVFLVRER